MTDDFINSYVELMGKITDAPSEFQELASLYLMSASVGRRFIFLSVPETSIFVDDKSAKGRLLNLWVILIGKTRISRKSTGVINKVEELSEYLKLNVLPHSFSPEYLVTEMSNLKESGEVWVSSIIDECGLFFDLLKKEKSSYMVSADSMLSVIYDGRTYKRGTQARGKEDIPNPYLTMLWASTDYLPKLFTDKMIRQGFLNRFIFVVRLKKDRKMSLRTNSLNDFERAEVEYVKRFLHALRHRADTVVIVLKSEAKEIYEKFESKVEEAIENKNLGLKEGYWGALPNFVIRIACLCRLSRMSPEEIEAYRRPILVVEKEDMERAIEYGRKIWANFEEVMKLKEGGEEEEVKTVEKYEKKIIGFYAKVGRKTLSQNYLRRRSKIETGKLRKVLHGIALEGFGESTGGRKPIEWTLLDETVKEHGLEHLS